MTIDGVGHSVTISGDNTFGVFLVYSGETGGLNHLTITDGHALEGGGILNLGKLTVQNSTFSGNSAPTIAGGGGGINNNGTLTVQNSLFSYNSAISDGGGINNEGTLTVQNSTFSGNSTSDGGTGGGINNHDTLTVQNSTFSGNSAKFGSGINNYQATLNLSNTIIANSTPGGDCTNPAAIATNDHNLIKDGSCCTALSGDPKLGPLADNGGPTQTMALLAGSPAINAGNNANCLGTDQRGTTRPQPAGGTCDIGAFELGDTTPPSVTVNQATGQADPTDASPINFTAVFNKPINTATFTAAKDTVTGTTGATTAVITESAPNDGTTFNIAVSGLTANGTVIVTIPAGGIQELSGILNTASTSTDNTVTYDIIDPVVVARPNTTPANGTVLTAGITGLTVQFSKDVVHDGGPEAADNPANYLLVGNGRNGKFDTLACEPAGIGGLQTDDVRITVDSVSYYPVQFVATLNVNGGKKLPDGRYRLFVCGTTSISDFSGNNLNGGKDTTITFSIRQPVASAPAIPSAGFAPGVVTHQPRQPAGQFYAATSRLWVEIPKLGVQMACRSLRTATGMSPGWRMRPAGCKARPIPPGAATRC
jgi:hypothetical protein